MAEILACKYAEEFTTKFMVPQYGFESIDHFYSEINLAGRLNRIKVPCLILNAYDDMFQVSEFSYLVALPNRKKKGDGTIKCFIKMLQHGRSLPFAEVLESDNCALILTKHGGHSSFTEGWLPFGYSYSDRMICQVVKAFGSSC